MRTVYGPNPIPTPSSDVEMEVDVPEVEEVTFTLVTNKKSKGKVSSVVHTGVEVCRMDSEMSGLVK